MMRKLVCLFAAACLAPVGSIARGQDGMLEELYGRGVHAFFARDVRSAHSLLSSAITSGSRDPRAYYFRGLANNRLGRPDEAKSDFHKGAELEALGGEPYPVARSLERVQGSERMALEAQRRLTRLAIHNTQSARDQIRYQQTQRNEAEAIRNPGRVAPAGAPPVRIPDATDPFAGGPTPPAVDPPAPLLPPAAAAPPAVLSPPPAVPLPAPATPALPPAADPFATPPATVPLAEPAPAPVTPPVSEPSAPPAPRPAPAVAPPADDPFGTPATPPAAAPAPTPPASTPPAAPAPAPAAPPADDPFASPATPPAAAPTTPPAPAAAPTTPPATRAPAPAAPPKNDDPFADTPAAPLPSAAPTTPPAAPAPAPTTPPAPAPADPSGSNAGAGERRSV